MHIEKTVAIFGGTFDPVHNGHLTTAAELQHALNVDEMRLLPCAVPAHRPQPIANPQQRQAMLQLAIDNNNLFFSNSDYFIDNRELLRQSENGGHPSYTIDTLKSLRDELGNNVSLILCMGSDAFASLPTWQDWNHLLDYAHIVVAKRPDSPAIIEPALLTLLTENRTNIAENLTSKPAGLLHQIELSQVPLSSTLLRTAFKTGKLPPNALPCAVKQYIETQGLYHEQHN